MKKILFYFVTIIAVGSCTADVKNKQFSPTIGKGFKYQYYVPVDIEDAVKELDHALSTKQKSKFQEIEDKFDLAKFHDNPGSWLRRHWFYEGSRLSNYFKKYSVEHRDNMSGIVIHMYWSKLKNKDIKFSELAEAASYSENTIFRPAIDKCPDGSNEKFKYVIMASLPIDDDVEFMHAGICIEKKQYWTYQYKKGFKLATQAQIDMINAFEKLDKEEQKMYQKIESDRKN